MCSHVGVDPTAVSPAAKSRGAEKPLKNWSLLDGRVREVGTMHPLNRASANQLPFGGVLQECCERKMPRFHLQARILPQTSDCERL
jgi:hypothetical protein